jgi:hypothetical protein
VAHAAAVSKAMTSRTETRDLIRALLGTAASLDLRTSQ